MRYDIVIVGGGPAGSTAAVNLAGRGLNVLLIDKSAFPREKACGGGISYRIFQRFPYLADTIRSVPINSVRKVYLESPSGIPVVSERETALYIMVRRCEFDSALLGHSARQGVEVRQGCRVTSLSVLPDGVRIHTSGGERIETDLVIGADGVNSTVAIKSGLRKGWGRHHVAIDMMEETAYHHVSVDSTDTMYVFYGYGTGYGYGYVFPKREHVNLGIGYRLDYYHDRVKQPPYTTHAGFFDRLRTKGVVQGTSQRQNFTPYVVPVGGPLSALSSDRVLLIGDAAGFVNGFTAEGIYYGMVSGEHAARVAAAAVRAGKFGRDVLRAYDRDCLAEIGAELALSVQVQKVLLGQPRLIDQIVAAAGKDEGLRNLLADFAVGLVDVAKFKRLLLTKATRFYLRYKLGKFMERWGEKVAR
jgi:geranylgeranyl reductase family protein